MSSFHVDGTQPQNGEVFVFGSNLAGFHGAGAARAAWQRFGAKWGKGIGICGQSYAIPTKDENIVSLDLADIIPHITAFCEYTKEYPHIKFWVTRVGCVLAGYEDADIAPYFFALDNISYPYEWETLINYNIHELDTSL